MRKAIVIFSFFFSLINAQDYNLRFDPLHEIFCALRNSDSVTTFSLSQVGQVWNAEIISSDQRIFSYDTEGLVDGGLFHAEPHPTFLQGFNYIGSSENANYNTEDFGFGLYKLEVKGDFVYLDFRDTRYCDTYNYCTGHCADIYILYDYSLKSLFLRNTPQCDTCTWENPLSNGDYLKIWEIKNQGLPNTQNVPGFWKNCLAIIESGNNSPRLIWGKHPTFAATNYKVYRAISSVPNPRTLTYTLIHTTSSANAFEYTDTDLMLGNSDYVFYYVTAYNSSTNTSSEPSNIATTRAGMYKQNHVVDETTRNESKYSLSQNTPNPFNPSTMINYSIPEA